MKRLSERQRRRQLRINRMRKLKEAKRKPHRKAVRLEMEAIKLAGRRMAKSTRYLKWLNNQMKNMAQQNQGEDAKVL